MPSRAGTIVCGDIAGKLNGEGERACARVSCMKLIGISRVKNEIDIIEAFARHNARHVDKLILLDDGSTDGSYEVLCALRDAGLPLVVLREASIGYEQSR